MKLIVDSGSTKTAWYVMSTDDNSEEEFLFYTAGLNPVRDDESVLSGVIASAVQRLQAHEAPGRVAPCMAELREVHYYGAGCLPSKIPLMQRLLGVAFPSACVSVDSDLLGAARALCGSTEGIACILGTGSNSCLYDGDSIVANTPALGWILGDEGSGAVLGRTLVADLLKGCLPEALRTAFMQRFALTPDAIIDAVYRKPQPNRLLASFVPFLAEHAAEPAIHRLLIDAFCRFFTRNVKPYERRDLPVSFVGGVAAQFENELREAAETEGFKVGRIEKSPIKEMVAFHRNK